MRNQSSTGCGGCLLFFIFFFGFLLVITAQTFIEELWNAVYYYH